MSGDELDIEKRWLQLARLDPEAFDRFYAKYFDAIYRFCLRRTLDHHAAEDLTAETFLRAQRSLGRFRWRNVTFGAYLYRIAQNLVRMRARTAAREVALGDAAASLVDPRLNPLAQVVLTQDQLAVRAAVAQLETGTQEVLLLHYWEGLAASEIAAVLGMKATTVKTRLHRGRLRLRSLVSGDGPDSGTGNPTDAEDGRRRDRS